MFDAQISGPQVQQTLHNCEIYRDVLVKNRGGVRKAVFCSGKIDAHGLSNADVHAFIATGPGIDATIDRFQQVMFTLGDNGHGYSVQDAGEVKRQQQLDAEQALLRGQTPVDVGVDALFPRSFLIYTQLPKEMWRKLRPHARYWSAQELDEMDLFGLDPGWRYELEALDIMVRDGLQVVLDGTPLKTADADEVAAAHEAYTVRQREKRDDEHKRKAYRAELQTRLDTLFTAAEAPADCSEAEGAAPLHLLAHTGSNGYGGGSWYHLTATHFWFVRDNGADGDAWDLNNYRTGGAGAIARRISCRAGVEALIAEVLQFEGRERGASTPPIIRKRAEYRELTQPHVDRALFPAEDAELVETGVTWLSTLAPRVFIGRQKSGQVALGVHHADGSASIFGTGGSIFAFSDTPERTAFVQAHTPDWSLQKPPGRYVWPSRSGGYRAAASAENAGVAGRFDTTLDQIGFTPGVTPVHIAGTFSLWSDGVAVRGRFEGAGEKPKSLSQAAEKLVGYTLLPTSAVAGGWLSVSQVESYTPTGLDRAGGSSWEVTLEQLAPKNGPDLYLVSGYRVYQGEDADIAEEDGLFTDLEDARRFFAETRALFG